jgi:hypothetical protein
MSKRKSPRPKRNNVTRHRRTVANPSIRNCIEDLRSHWDELDRVSKGERLRDLIGCGCSTRGLADELPISGTSVRRYIESANLPKKAIEAIRSGYSAKKLLNFQEHKVRQSRHQDRIELDATTGELSNGLADTILAFCRTAKGFPLRTIRRSVSRLFLE